MEPHGLPSSEPASRLGRMRDGLSYFRHLARGNRIRGELGWVRPDAAPVILVHGFMGNRGTLVPLAARLRADGRPVFTYNQGLFQLGSLRSSAEDLAERLRTIENDLGHRHVDVIGFSMGGLVALHALKFMQAHRSIRRLVLLGSPTDGTWAGLAGVATVGLVSPSVWQCLPGSPFIEDLKAAPMPRSVRVRQIHATDDGFCPPASPVEGVDVEGGDYVILPGGHSSLLVGPAFYEKVRDFLDEPGFDARSYGAPAGAETIASPAVPV